MLLSRYKLFFSNVTLGVWINLSEKPLCGLGGSVEHLMDVIDVLAQPDPLESLFHPFQKCPVT